MENIAFEGSYPTILYFKHDIDTDNLDSINETPVVYDKERTEEAFIKFLENPDFHNQTGG